MFVFDITPDSAASANGILISPNSFDKQKDLSQFEEFSNVEQAGEDVASL
jgi:hypothetical protein